MDIEQELTAAKRARERIREEREDLAPQEALVAARIQVLEQRCDARPVTRPVSRTDRALETLRRCGEYRSDVRRPTTRTTPS